MAHTFMDNILITIYIYAINGNFNLPMHQLQQHILFYLSCYGWIEESPQFVDVGVWWILHLKAFLS